MKSCHNLPCLIKIHHELSSKSNFVFYDAIQVQFCFLCCPWMKLCYDIPCLIMLHHELSFSRRSKVDMYKKKLKGRHVKLYVIALKAKGISKGDLATIQVHFMAIFVDIFWYPLIGMGSWVAHSQAYLHIWSQGAHACICLHVCML